MPIGLFDKYSEVKKTGCQFTDTECLVFSLIWATIKEEFERLGKTEQSIEYCYLVKTYSICGMKNSMNLYMRKQDMKEIKLIVKNAIKQNCVDLKKIFKMHE